MAKIIKTTEETIQVYEGWIQDGSVARTFTARHNPARGKSISGLIELDITFTNLENKADEVYVRNNYHRLRTAAYLCTIEYIKSL